jgi:pantothenate kinase-related protein Tda10
MTCPIRGDVHVARRWNTGRGRHAPRSGVLALDDCYMTTAEQGRGRHAPRSGVLALDDCYMTAADQGRGRHAPRSGVCRP